MSFFRDLTLLAAESASVIDLRLAKIGRGGPEAVQEVQLMYAEKMGAVIGASAALMSGMTSAELVSRLRTQVACNDARLRPE